MSLYLQSIAWWSRSVDCCINYKNEFYRLHCVQHFNRLCLLQVTNTTRKNCSGIAVLPPSVFYSIRYSSWELLFDEARSDEVVRKVDGSYGVHVWNKLSSEEKITVGSKQAYGLLAEKYCPRVYRSCGPVFWCFYVWLCCHRYRTVEIPSFVNRVTQLLVGFICVCKIAKSVMSVRPCVPPHGTNRFPLEGFSWNLIIFEGFFWKFVEKFSFHENETKKNGYFTLRPINIFDHILLISSRNEKYFKQKR